MISSGRMHTNIFPSDANLFFMNAYGTNRTQTSAGMTMLAVELTVAVPRHTVNSAI